MGFNSVAKRRAGALLAGTFMMGVVGGALVDGLPATPALAQNLSEQVPDQTRSAPGFADIVDRVSPAVVSIQVKSRAGVEQSSMRGLEGSPFERFFEDFEERFGQAPNGQRPGGPRGGDNQGRQGRVQMGQGSGFIISPDGYIVTNGHVVAGAEEVDVILQDGKQLTAEVIGVDDKTDLALVKVKSDEKLPFVEFAPHETRVGDWVVAVGNPFGLGGTVTAGIVSARGREIGAGPYDDFIQIDAPINRGNSGGPTFNLEGEVVGVNTAIFSPSGGSVGIGFAIPASIASAVIDDLKDDGTVTRGWLGVQIQPITPQIAESIGLDNAEGALVTDPQGGSPAQKAGVRQGDAIVSVDGQSIEGPRALARTISTKAPDSVVTLGIVRDGRKQDVRVTLGRLSDDQPEQRTGQADEPEQREETPAAMLGMTLAPSKSVGMDGDGLAVVEVEPDGIAAQNGIQVGDVILQAGGVDVASARDFQRGVDQAKDGNRKNVLLKLQSGENARFVAVPVDEGNG